MNEQRSGSLFLTSFLSRAAVLFLVPVLILISGCVSPGSTFRKRTDAVESFTLVTIGEPDQHFTGTLKLDGVEKKISGVSPAQFPLEACVLAGTIQKTHGEGNLRFRVVSKQATLTFGNLSEPGQSFRFRYHDRGVEIWN